MEETAINPCNIKLESLETTSESVKQLSSPSDNEEKHDVSPENREKSSDTSPLSDGAQSNAAQAMAFTIEFDGAKVVDSQRHKNMLERFQSRHRRGVSMSKLEQSPSEIKNLKIAPPVKHLKSQLNAKLVRRNSKAEPLETSVRLRDKTNQIRDDSKRHSWSPRSSAHEPIRQSLPSKNKAFYPKSVVMTKALKSNMKIAESELVEAFACIEPPLELVCRPSDEDLVSEAGTYTLDGDKYTEEQKEKMNIDKMTQNAIDDEKLLRPSNRAIRPKNFEQELEVIDLEGAPEDYRPRKNILEVSYCHESTNLKPKVSYLEKLKSRVKNIGGHRSSKSPDKILTVSKPLPSPDVGTFTSITTSGVLSVQPTLETNPRMRRKNSLTKSHIDSSEYISRLTEKMSKPNVDNKKSIYQLNVFKNQPENIGNEDPVSSNTSISTAATKDDWIQEWARNAREYSRYSRQPDGSAPKTCMTRSYEFENTRGNQFGYEEMSKSDHQQNYEEFGDNLEKYYNQKSVQVQKPAVEIPNESHRTRQTNNLSHNQNVNTRTPSQGRHSLRDEFVGKKSSYNIKPPMSPSRIPSPIHTIGRARGSSRNRSQYGSETDLAHNDTEMYLQKTAAAISTLQNLHRRNSLRHSSMRNPSPMSPQSPNKSRMTTSPQILSPSRSSPRTRLELKEFTLPPHTIHRRNASLDCIELPTRFQHNMNHSSQSDSLNAIYDFGSKHQRHNSYEGMTSLPPRPSRYTHQIFDQTNHELHQDDESVDEEEENIPHRGVLSTNNVASHCEETFERKNSNNKSHTVKAQSSIKRSTSFSQKPMNSPALSKASKMPAKVNSQIQKSASSSSFKKMITKYEDDDEDSQFYINNDDDLIPHNQLSDSEYSDEVTATQEPPISNTRYNKTFLMRVEQSKAKAAKQPGVMACPNTPELPRRTSFRERTSMPRDSSLSRMKKELGVGTVKKPLLSGSISTPNSATKEKRISSKYLDISKYKTDRGTSFLKKDDSKTYLGREVKKSSSSICIQNAAMHAPAHMTQFQRVDATRTSSRSTKSAGSRLTSSNKKDFGKTAKEAELLMWKRRASYDPMKAAAEGKRKMEEAKRQVQQQQDKHYENSSVMRSQSYHSGVTNHQEIQSDSNQWALTSNESNSDIEDECTVLS